MNKKWILELNGDVKEFESLNCLLMFCFEKTNNQKVNYKEIFIKSELLSKEDLDCVDKITLVRLANVLEDNLEKYDVFDFISKHLLDIVGDDILLKCNKCGELYSWGESIWHCEECGEYACSRCIEDSNEEAKNHGVGNLEKIECPKCIENKNKKTHAVVLKAYATVFVKADSPYEAEQIALNNYDEGRIALISSIEINGYDADYNEKLSEEYADE